MAICYNHAMPLLPSLDAWSALHIAVETGATLAFALSGLIEAARKKLDAVGVVVVAGLTAFGGGIRCYYFGLAWLAWLIDPLAFIGAILAILVVLLRRQAYSHSHRAIRRFVELNPPDEMTRDARE